MHAKTVVDPRLEPGFKQILKEWRSFVMLFTRTVVLTEGPETGKPDAVFWNTERADIGVLAAAAWKCGVPALEEFVEPKGRRTKRRSGRVDLWLRMPDSDGVAFEAKHHMIHESNWEPSVVHNHLDEALSAAVSDAEDLDEGYPRRVGIAFVVPKIPARNQTDLTDARRRFLAAVESHQSHDLRSWAPAKDKRGQIPTWVGCFFPGVLLIGRIVPGSTFRPRGLASRTARKRPQPRQRRGSR